MSGIASINSSLEWITKLSIDMKPTEHRKSSIICTIGPKTNNVEVMNQLRQAGMNIVRMNFSHGSHEYHGSVIANIRKAQEVMPGRPVAIALDTKGPEIRTGLMTDGHDVPFQTGHEMIFSMDEAYAECGTADVIYVDYKNLPKVISKGKIIFVDDGIMSFEVVDIMEDSVRVRALNNGKLSSRKGVNLPKTDVDLPALSEKDKSDLRFGVAQGVDMIFASFIRTGQDVRDIREVLGEDGKQIKIIVKIENHQGVVNFDEILAETDGVMVARGDLGIEIPPESVFVAQKMIIAKCNIAGKPVICATQMLESMTTNPRPTRAEVSDVANAILDGADCVMLSGETAKGCYPLEAVSMMSHVAAMAEATICYPPLFAELRSLSSGPRGISEAAAISAVSASMDQNAAAIVVLSTSGTSARLVSKYRPQVPILTITRSEFVARQVHLYRGCYPFLYTQARLTTDDPQKEHIVWQEDVDSRIRWGIDQAIEQGLLQRGDVIIAIQGWKGGLGNTNTMRILRA
ncbi:Pyruvate kinase [Dimargaris cristalligena]|uniref:Pyruvate kinase n=1 Tax=Dimargaris cristalligena TaxID=215637 RepID=A0A4P9ZSJ3_9FUNG|nr:Pyruvate kinase [Dimargaris cristalligena]RKP35781.1 pyruvate kinase [Dimargaris cristalligena]|eukprot:RKP35781.1 pyruvate kinase [Dimargaris cristalligena]